MPVPRIRARAVAVALLGLVTAALAWPAPGRADQGFPFGQELLLDVEPMHGSKRVPSIAVEEGGAAQIDLWCHGIRGQVVIAGDTMTVMRGPITEQQCDEARMQRDIALMTALLQVTRWRRQEDVVILEGSAPLRFRLSTH